MHTLRRKNLEAAVASSSAAAKEGRSEVAFRQRCKFLQGSSFRLLAGQI